MHTASYILYESLVCCEHVSNNRSAFHVLIHLSGLLEADNIGLLSPISMTRSQKEEEQVCRMSS